MCPTRITVRCLLVMLVAISFAPAFLGASERTAQGVAAAESDQTVVGPDAIEKVAPIVGNWLATVTWQSGNNYQEYWNFVSLGQIFASIATNLGEHGLALQLGSLIVFQLSNNADCRPLVVGFINGRAMNGVAWCTSGNGDTGSFTANCLSGGC